MDAIPLKTDSLESVPENMQSLYAEVDGGGFEFQVPDIGAALRAKEHEKQARQKKAAEADEYKAQLSELKSQFDELKLSGQKKDAEKTGKWETIEASFAEKLAKVEQDYKGQLSQRDEMLQDLTVGQAASQLASKLFGSNAEVLTHVIKDRLTFDSEDGNPRVVVKDAQGNPSGLTLDDLHDEIYNNQKYSTFVVGSNASGGGANGSSAKGGGAAPTIKRADFLQLPESERKALLKKGVKTV